MKNLPSEISTETSEKEEKSLTLSPSNKSLTIPSNSEKIEERQNLIVHIQNHLKTDLYTQ